MTAFLIQGRQLARMPRPTGRGPDPPPRYGKQTRDQGCLDEKLSTILRPHPGAVFFRWPHNPRSTQRDTLHLSNRRVLWPPSRGLPTQIADKRL